MSERYTGFSAEDFAADLYFCEWVLHPNDESDRFWRRFVLENPGQAAGVEQAGHLVRALRMSWTQVPDAEALRSYRAFQKRLQARPPRRHAPRRLALAAASVLCLLGAAVWLYVQPARHVVRTGFGQVRTVRLPDGSAVTLNANTTLSYTDDWRQAGRRQVRLEGEAFFRVSHQEQAAPGGGKPVKFTVGGGDVDVEVLGTEFTVNSRRRHTRVALYRGKVRLLHLTRRQPALVMRPGQTAELAEGRQAITLSSTPPATRWLWHTNRLVFRAAPLRQVAQTLHDNYGLRVVFRPAALADQLFAGEVPAGRTDVLLTAIADAFGCQIKKEGRLTVIYR